MSDDPSTTTNDPTKTTSDELDRRHLELAREEGDAYQRSLRHMTEEVAEAGGTAQAGDYVVGFAQESAEGMYEFRDGGLEWVEPDDDQNCHLEAAVSDAADGRFVPYADVRATLVPEDDEGDAVAPVELPFVWHPGVYHYGANLQEPGDGQYTIRVEVDPPTFQRHDRENGDRYVDPVEVEFEGVEVTTGQS